MRSQEPALPTVTEKAQVLPCFGGAPQQSTSPRLECSCFLDSIIKPLSRKQLLLKKELPGKPVAHDYGPLSTNGCPLSGIMACPVELLGFPGTSQPVMLS